jgi:hypothetical protein
MWNPSLVDGRPGMRPDFSDFWPQKQVSKKNCFSIVIYQVFKHLNIKSLKTLCVQ